MHPLGGFARESKLLAGRLADPPIISENLVMIDGSVLEIFGISGAGYPRYPAADSKKLKLILCPRTYSISVPSFVENHLPVFA